MKFDFNIYQRHFKQPLRTSHGIWQIREGIIISLSNGDNLAQGEIAPLSWFGSETLSEAVEFCQQLGNNVTPEDIYAIPNSLPACQFGFESALLQLNQNISNVEVNNLDDLSCCYLLPAGEKALTSWKNINAGLNNATFKWKIGVFPLQEEIEILQRLVKVLPGKAKLRLDANGGLDLTQTKKLLTITDSFKTIEFIEQPLPPKCFWEMLQLHKEYSTPLALDESVASLEQLKWAHQQGWQGIFIIKASIMGFPSQLIKYCQQNSLDTVFSSVFETEIGRNAVLQLARQLNSNKPKNMTSLRAVGFGVNHLFS